MSISRLTAVVAYGVATFIVSLIAWGYFSDPRRSVDLHAFDWDAASAVMTLLGAVASAWAAWAAQSSAAIAVKIAERARRDAEADKFDRAAAQAIAHLPNIVAISFSLYGIVNIAKKKTSPLNESDVKHAISMINEIAVEKIRAAVASPGDLPRELVWDFAMALTDVEHFLQASKRSIEDLTAEPEYFFGALEELGSIAFKSVDKAVDHIGTIYRR